jgi:glycosyltransferase involved in cell wall biosynthesis
VLPDAGIRVRNLGSINAEEQLVQLYRAADLCVVPSRQENLPNMIMETMSCGTPCVAFAVGGVPELVAHGENGYLAHPGDVEDLARGILTLLRDERQRTVMSQKARNWVEGNVSLERIAARHLDLYRELTRSGVNN